MAPRTSFVVDSLETTIPAVFDQVQASAATHKKNCVALYKLHSAAAEVVESVNRGRKDAEVKFTGERAFAETFMSMLNRVLVVRKSTPAADRIVKFVASYIKFLNEKVPDSDEDETPASRFVSRLLKYFLKGLQAKSKEVRSRCLHFISDIMCNLGELDQTIYAELRLALLERLADKESLVRVYAVSALSILASSEDPYDLEDDEPPIISCLVESLFYDPAAEVRRAALVHIPFNPTTFPSLLTRMRDVDALTRKLVFTVVLPRLVDPRQLTIAQREQVVLHGLGDRTEAVRVAAGKVLASWVDVCEGDLSAFVSLFDVHSPDIAHNALKSVFVSRTNVVDEVEFDDNFWSNLKPEMALLARSFVEYCIDNRDETRLEATLPVVTALAFRLQTAYNHYLAILEQFNDEKEDDDDNVVRKEQVTNAELVMGELLRVAVHLDYSDEIGRRKMFCVARNLLAHPEFPESLIEPCVGVLHIMSPNERDLIRIIVEVISELRDSGGGPEDPMGTEDDGESTFSTARPGGISRTRSRKDTSEISLEEKMEADMTDLRCLSLCIAVLERIHGSFEENSTLIGILEDLVVPSVQRKELALRERGLVCLGLCCLIAKNMALSSFQLFLSQVKGSPESLRLKVLQVVFDIMMTYEKDLFGSAESIGERVVTFLMQILEAEQSKRVQALMCLGLSKLMLFGLVTDERILMSLIFAYVSPTNADNQELRQCLAYFLPAYCYSSSANQMRLQSVFVKTMQLIFQAHEELDDDQNMLTPLQFGQLLIDWTNPSKVVGADEKGDQPLVHVHLAIDLVRALYDNEQPVENRKTLTLLLNRLVFPNDIDQKFLYTLYILVCNLTEVVPFEDSATGKTFLRFKTRLEKHFAGALVDYDEQACFNDPESTYNDVFEFLGTTRPKRRRYEGRAEVMSVPKETEVLQDDDVSEADDGTDAHTPGPSRSGPRRRPQPKPRQVNRKKVASSKDTCGSDSSGDEEEPEQRMANVAPSRSRRTATRSPIVQASEASSDGGDGMEKVSDTDSRAEEDKKSALLPSTPPRKRGTKRLHTPTKSPSVASPMAKRQTRRKKKAKPSGRVTSRVATKALKNRTNKQKSTPARGGRHAPPKLKTLAEETEGLSTADEDDAPSEASIPQHRKQPNKTRAPHPTPRLLDEKIGWDSSSDI